MDKEFYREIVNVAIKVSDPEKILPLHIRRDNNCLYIDSRRICLENGKIYVVGAGKASGKMALAIERILGNLIEKGVIAIPYYMSDLYKLEKIQLVEAGHPIPNEGSIKAAEKILDIAGKAGENDVLISLISGGGSALMEKPIQPITLDDLKITNKLLLESGADIREINIVRKHLSEIKGGRLAVKAGKAKYIVSLMISDVPGDNPEYIASGPTVPDSSTYIDAKNVLERYDLWDKVPESVRIVIEKGIRGEIEETPKHDHPVFRKTINKIIASNYTVLRKLSEYFRDKGYTPYILTTRLEGESSEVGKVLASIAMDISDRDLLGQKPLVLLLGGEPNVSLKGQRYGKGGRCQELVLSFLATTRGRRDLSIIAFDTDGVDGFSDAAGAYGDYEVWENMSKNRDSPWSYLREHNSYEFFRKYNGLIITGPTGTNVNIVVAVIIHGSKSSGQ
ncbi:glycerate kinase type-2 family protein [Staphylothermus marinus]|nr:glycerate kinase [Staphylothermus marinus]